MLNRMRQADVYQEKSSGEKARGPFGIDSRISDIMTDEASTEALLDILEECRGARQPKGALYMIGKYEVKQIFALMKLPVTEEKLAEYDRKLRDSWQI